MDAIKLLIRDNPTIVAGAVRQTLLAAVLLGLHLDETQIIGVMLAVEAVLTAINYALVTPNQKFDAAVNAEAENIVTAIVDDRPMTPAEAARIDHQIDRLKADLDREMQRGT